MIDAPTGLADIPAPRSSRPTTTTTTNTITPDFDAFAELAAQGDLVVLSRTFPFDTDTAVTAYAKLASARPAGQRFGFLLESVTGGEKWARYTFLGTRPRSAWRLDPAGSVSRWTPDAGWSEPEPHDDPLDHLAGLLRSQAPVAQRGLPRFFGGAVGYLGYDVVRYIERLPEPPEDDLGLPDAVLMITDLVLAIDNVYGRAHAMATVDVAGAADRAALRARYDDAVARIDEMVETLEREPAPPRLEPRSGVPASFESNMSRERYEDGVRRVKEYIAAGDAFQVVLSQRLSVPLEDDPFTVYRSLRSLNPSPYMYFLELDDIAVAGASPEVLVRVEDGRVVVRPIAGTRPRADTEAGDRAAIASLRADEKERAEHLMLVDLGRNDVGRVAEYGSVTVPDMMVTELYSHVIHLVSQVEGRVREDLDAMDVFRATFPAGTVSGAPKVRAMEIIDELEPTRRGVYAGAVGYFGWGGRSMDTAIAIRTLVAKDGRAWVQAGAGIVADSEPAREYEETLAKARALLAVLGR